MKVVEFKTGHRALAMILAIMLLVGLTPTTTVWAAESPTSSYLYTFVVKDGDKPIQSAAITCTVAAVSGSDYSKTLKTDANGKAQIDLSAYVGKEMQYEVTKEHYKTANGTIDVSNDTDSTISVSLSKPTVSVVQTGKGSVTLNDTESAPLSVNKGSKVSVKVEPAENWKINSIKIGGKRQTIENAQSFSADVTINDDVTIDVNFVSLAVINVINDGNGTVKLNDADPKSVKLYVEDTPTLSVTPNYGYRIASIKVNDAEQAISDKSQYKGKITITETTTIDVAFEKLSVIVVRYNENGVVTYDNNNIANEGSVKVKNGDYQLELTATPKENHRLSQVTISSGGESDTTTFSGNEYTVNTPYELKFTADKNYTVDFIFAPMIYNITAEDAVNGSLTVVTETVDHGESATIKVEPVKGYKVDAVEVYTKDTVNGEDTYTLAYEGKEAYTLLHETRDGVLLTIHNVTKDQKVKVTFKECGVVDIGSIDSIFNINSDDLVRKDGNLYVFKKGTTVKIDTTMRLTFADQTKADGYWSEEPVEITENTTVIKVEVHNDYTWEEAQIDGKTVQLEIAFDQTPPKVTVTPQELPNEIGIYNHDINVDIKVSDPDVYSGIKTIEYQIIANEGASDETITKTESIAYEGQNEVSKTIEISAKENNYCNVTLRVVAKDMAGNESEEVTQTFDFDVTAPTVAVSFSDLRNDDAHDGYFTGRTATVVIKERDHHFNQTAATEAIRVTLDGNNDKSAYNVVWGTVQAGDTPDDGTHTATVTFLKEGKYSLDVQYTDQAGNKSNQYQSGNFVIDHTSPTGTIAIKNSVLDRLWNSVLATIPFDLPFDSLTNGNVAVTAEGKDETSEFTLSYYKTAEAISLSYEELNQLYQDGKFTIFADSDLAVKGISPNDQAVIYLRVTDYAGNYTYVRSDGIIVEGTPPKVTVTPQEQPNEKGIYNHNIKVDISVTDPDIYSGIKEVSYWIVANGTTTIKETLYSFTTEKPTKAQLKQTYHTTIEIDAEANNYCDAVLHVGVTDNAGNTSEEVTQTFDFDVTAPEVSVTFVDTANKDAQKGYFTGRTATVVIKERDHHFNQTAATEAICVTLDGNNDKSAYNVVWGTVQAGDTPDDDTHTATVTFLKEGTYSLDVQYTDQAGNKSNQYQSGNFVIDHTSPTGTIAIKNSVLDRLWNSVLAAIPFDLPFDSLTNGNVAVTAEGKDETSEFTLNYYKTEEVASLSYEELNQLYQDDKFTVFADSDLAVNGISPNEQAVIYLRVTDYAGNYTYVRSDGIIVEKTAAQISVVPQELPNDNGIYNHNLKVDISVTDPDIYSGIKEVSYWIVANGTTTIPETLYSFTTENPTKAQLKQTYYTTIEIDAEANNYCDAVLHVGVTDNAGNYSEAVESFDFDVTAPKIDVTFKDRSNEGAKDNYFTERTAIITVTERTKHFDKDLATESIKITAKDYAKDYKANEVDDAYTISDWDTVEDENNPNNTTHTAKVTFEKDANYTFDFTYDTDRADNKCENPFSPVKFTVDKNKPEGNITVDDTKYASSKIPDILNFTHFSSKNVSVSVEASDKTSDVTVEYYKTSDTALLKYSDLDTLYKADSTNQIRKNFAVFENSNLAKNGINPNEQAVIYLRITDYAGNYIYIRTNGIVADDVTSDIELTYDEPAQNDIYTDNLDVDIVVNDTDPYSGIKEVKYWVVANENDKKWNKQTTQSDTLYSFKIENPTQEQLEQTFSETIQLIAEQNNYCDVTLHVGTTDNAGNYKEETRSFDFDVTAPVSNVSFDGKSLKEAEKGYFVARTATITVTERTDHFDETLATESIKITAEDYNKNAVDDAYTISDWETVEGTNPNSATHTAVVTFVKDANYTFDFTYDTDIAGNQGKRALDEPEIFTVDTTNPTAQLEILERKWTIIDKVISWLTFDLYSRKNTQVVASAKDLTSPTVISYYKTDNPIALKTSELDDLYANGEFKAFKNSDLAKNGVNPNEQFVVYLRIRDYAGNYIYLHSDGVIVDNVASEIQLSYAKPNGNGIYNSNLRVDITVTDAEPYSGIKNVKYWVVANENTKSLDTVTTQEKSLFDFSVTNPTQKDLEHEIKRSITIDAVLNNYCDVTLHVGTTDNAGNYNEKKVKLDFDVIAPEIKVVYNNNSANKVENGRGYFGKSRTATVVITERTAHFDAKAATENITIEAVDAGGKVVALDTGDMISEWEPTEIYTDDGTWLPDQAAHTATITFDTDANYTFGISYIDMADNANRAVNTDGQTTPYTFTIDKTEPFGTVTAKSKEGRELTWSTLVNYLTFGFWSKEGISVTGTSDDATSPIDSVEYYTAVSKNANDETVALDKAALDAAEDWQTFEAFDILPNNQMTVYIKITDYAGNYQYISTNGLIVDDQLPVEESVAPEITVTPEQPINGIYNGDVKVSITVDDPLVGGTYSGLNKIIYRVFDRESATPNTPTQEETLYSFENSNPVQAELRKTWNGEITVKSAKNNSNDIQIVVYAVDNAGNGIDNADPLSQSYTTIKIDTTAPVIDISYDNNNADSGTYFKANRTATVKITERNFNANDVMIKITNTDGSIPAVVGWKNVTGSKPNKDDSTHTATITYNADGDYTFAIEYTDLAGNKCQSVNYAAGTVAGTQFTIDKTTPTVQVSYNNNSAQNKNYYNKARTATIVINEHNFSTDRVNITIKATDNGAAKSTPSVSRWSTNGDRHTAIISYSSDALYTFDIEYTDLAGNKAADYSPDTFYVDQTAPTIEISGIAKSSNNGDIIPVITYKDTNFNRNAVSVVLSGVHNGTVNYSHSIANIANGQTITYSNFEKVQGVDDIYTLTVKLTDMAGNQTSKTMTFSANRFGSVYDISKVEGIVGKYLQTEEDIIFTETNVDSLDRGTIKIKLTKNGIPTDLEEGKDYTVVQSGGNGKWAQYQYKISKKLFADDGVYSISVYSVDAAKNVNENIDESKQSEISFGVDKTKPEIISIDVESGVQYAVETKPVSVEIKDNLVLGAVRIYLNDKPIDYTVDGDVYSFDIPKSNSRQSVKIVVVDAANNETELTIDKILVATNIFVRWYNNTPLFVGSIAGTAILVIAIIAFVLFGRRRKEAY